MRRACAVLDFVKAEYARWEPIVKASGVRID
jgi:hypothetical protein